jgi:hypothetical protein
LQPRRPAMSDTPRTDAEAGEEDASGCWKGRDEGPFVDADFARQLERELAAMRERAEKAEAERDEAIRKYKDIHYRIAQGMAWEKVYRLCVELGLGTKGDSCGIDRVLDFIKQLSGELEESRAYADKLAAGLPDGMLPKDVEVLRKANGDFAAQLETARALLRDLLDSGPSKTGYGMEWELACREAEQVAMSSAEREANASGHRQVPAKGNHE